MDFNLGNQIFTLENFFIYKISPPEMKGEIYGFYSKGYSKIKKQYYKSVIPLSKEINFHFTIKEFVFSSDTSKWSRIGTKIIMNGEDIIIVQEKDENKNWFLIIQSKKKQSYEEFSDKVFSIRIALGYVTGHLAGDEGYFFSYSRKEMKNFKHFYYRSLRSEIITLMNPLNSNPFAWIRNNKKVANKYYNEKCLETMSIENFSNLCNLLVSNDDFTATLLLIIESSKASLIFRPSGYSIALETLSDIVIGDENYKLSPITSKPDNKKFRKELNEVLDKHSVKESFKDIKTLKGRIEHINQMTNGERLKAPFSVLGINLLQEDLNVISSRNDFLHGRVPDFKNLGVSRSINLKDNDLYYASVRLYTLINLLIFKMVGYKGYVLNFPKIYELDTKYKVKEDYYRKIE
ncbi:hypothetical protein [Flavobacterium gyeonganense]|uniref:hypothetical protein n=1 Tax=Flavobacterium gyeonganense TaxID=1310418 RepID=UPI002413D072|nr:hypothetical protein [Flavobacterium gyeonganense]